MTPDQLQELANSLSDLRNAVNQLNGASSIMANSFNRAVQGISQLDPNVRRVVQQLDQSVNATQKAGNAIQQEQARAIQAIQTNQKAAETAFDNLATASKGMASALMATTAGLNNLAGVGKAASDAITYLGVRMGAASGVAGSVAGAFGGLVKAGIDQANAYLQVKNELTKLGAAGQQTVSSLYAYAQAAGLHTDTINFMVAPMKALGSNIMGLGRGAADAQKAFMEMLQTSDQERERFARLGIMQEELITRQGDYVALQTSTGSSIRMQNMTMEQLRKASTDYIRNLYDLSAITGEEVNKLRDKQQQALFERRIMLETMAKQQEAAEKLSRASELEATGRPEDREEAGRLRQEAQNTLRELEVQRDLIRSLADLPESLRTGIIQAMTSGGISGKEAETLARMGALDKILQQINEAKAGGKTGMEAGAEIRKILANQAYANLPGIVKALQMGDEELSKSFGYDLDTMPFYTKTKGREIPDELLDAQTQRTAAEKRGVDAASDLQAALQTVSIGLNQLADNIIAGPNPLIQNFNLLGESAKAATIALQNLAGERALGQEAVDKMITGLDYANKGTDYANKIINDPLQFFKNLFGNQPARQDLPEVRRRTDEEAPRGGESTLGRQTSPSTPPPPPTVQATPAPTVAPQDTAPTSTPVAVPVTTPVAPQTTLGEQVTPDVETQPTRPATAPAVTPNTILPQTTPAAPPTTAARPTTQTTPSTATTTPIDAQDNTALSAESTPLPNYRAVTVKTNLGNNLTLSGALVGKFVAVMKEGKNREQLRQQLLQWIPKNNRYDNATLDRMIDKVAQEAGLPKLPGSSAETITPQATTVTTPIKPPEAPAMGATGAARPAATTVGTTPAAQTGPTTAVETQGPRTQPSIRITQNQLAWADKRYADLIKEGKTATDAESIIRKELIASKYSQDQINEILKRVTKTQPPVTGQTTFPAPTTDESTTSIKLPQNVLGDQDKGRRANNVGNYAERIQQALQSGGLTAKTPLLEASKIQKPETPKGNIETSLDKLISSNLLNSKVIRGPQERPLNPELLGKAQQGGADKDRRTADTHGEGYSVSPKLVEAIMKLQDAELAEGFTLSQITAINDYYHAKKHPNSAHTKGRAIDFILNKAPSRDEAQLIRENLRGLGFINIKDEYNNPTEYTQGAHFHAEVPKMAKGGIISGSKSGFPATLHGNEIVIPLDPNSILADLGKKSQEQIKTEISSMQSMSGNDKIDPVIFQDMARQNQQLMEMIGYKLDNVINKLDTGNDTQNKILKYSQA
jgi:hypothetical protein